MKAAQQKPKRKKAAGALKEGGDLKIAIPPVPEDIFYAAVNFHW